MEQGAGVKKGGSKKQRHGFARTFCDLHCIRDAVRFWAERGFRVIAAVELLAL